MENHKISITAHAGCMNTKMDSIESINAGIKYQVDIIEIDLNEDENGQLVLSHNTPEKNIEYKRFETALELVKNEKILLNIDVKNLNTLEKANRIITNNNMRNKVFFTGITFENFIKASDKLWEKSCFINLEPPKLDTLKIHNEFYLNELMNEIKNLKALGINIFYKFASSKLVEACKANKLLCSVWTVDQIDAMHNMIGLGVDSITTKKIDTLQDLLKLQLGGNNE